MNAPRFSLTNLGPSKQTKRIIHNLLIVKVSTRKSGRTCIFSLGSNRQGRARQRLKVWRHYYWRTIGEELARTEEKMQHRLIHHATAIYCKVSSMITFSLDLIKHQQTSLKPSQQLDQSDKAPRTAICNSICTFVIGSLVMRCKGKSEICRKPRSLCKLSRSRCKSRRRPSC